MLSMMIKLYKTYSKRMYPDLKWLCKEVQGRDNRWEYKLGEELTEGWAEELKKQYRPAGCDGMCL